MCKVNKSGFTLIELSFSLVFISVLSLAVVFVIISTIKTYNRGILLNRVNSVGMDLVDDMRFAVQNSSAESLVSKCETIFSSDQSNLERCKSDNGRRLVSVSRTANVKIGNANDIGSVPVFGAFCTGEYSYIWRSGYLASNDYAVSNVGGVSLKYKIEDSGRVKVDTLSDFNLLKVHDTERAVCASAVSNNYLNSEISGAFDITDSKYMVVDTRPVVLLSSSENSNLVLYGLSSSLPAEGGEGNIMFYAVSFILGSVQGGINVKASGNFCSTKGDETENLDFCSVNKFNFAAMATGR